MSDHVAAPNLPHSLPTFTDYLASNQLTPAQQAGLATELDRQHLGLGDGISFIPLPDGTTVLQNADGDIVGQLNVQADGSLRWSGIDGERSYIQPSGEVLAQQAMDQATAPAPGINASQTATAIGLLNSIVGLQNWDEMGDVQRAAALASIYNVVDNLNGGELPGDLGSAAGALGLVTALQQGNIGGAVYSGLALVESLTTTSQAAGLVTQTFGGNFLPALGMVLALQSGDPVAIASSSMALMSSLSMIGPWGMAAAAIITLVGTIMRNDDIPTREGQAHAQWDDAGHLQIVTDLDTEGGGVAAASWMRGMVDGLQSRLAGSGSSLVPGLLPAIGYILDPDGQTPAHGAAGFVYLQWVDDQGQTQTRYYDGQGNRNDGSGETLAGDFLRHAAGAIAPDWAVATAQAHWQQGITQAQQLEGQARALEQQAADTPPDNAARASELQTEADALHAQAQAVRAAAQRPGLPDAGLPDVDADGLHQTIHALVLGAATTPAERAVDTDGDGYLERTQWLGEHQAGLALDADGDGVIRAGELVGGRGDGAIGSAGRTGLDWLDANSDGVLDSSDPAFAALRLWVDADGNGQSRPDGSETRSLLDAGIVAIDFRSDPPTAVHADGSREVLGSQSFVGDVLGNRYDPVTGGVLQSTEQADGSATRQLIAVNTRAFDGQAEHVHEGENVGGGTSTVAAGDARLVSTGANTVAGANRRTDTVLAVGDARVASGAAGSVRSGQSAGRSPLADSAAIRGNGERGIALLFADAAASPAAAMREATADMVRAAERGTLAGVDGAGMLGVVAAAMAAWPALADAGAPAVTPQAVPVAVPNAVHGGSDIAPSRVPAPDAMAGPIGSASPSAASIAAVSSAQNLIEASTNHVPPTEGISANAFTSIGAPDRASAEAAAVPSPVTPFTAVTPSQVSHTPDAQTTVAPPETTVFCANPNVGGDTANGAEDVALRWPTAWLLANDRNMNSGGADASGLQVVAVEAPRHGSVSLQTDAAGTMQIVFMPDADYHGEAGFSYTAVDAFGFESRADVVLQIAAVNDAPVTADEAASGNEDQALYFNPTDLLANDADVDTAVDGDMLSIRRVGAAEHGQVSLRADGVVVFVPDADYHGPANFTYWVTDRNSADLAATGHEVPATVRVTVLPVNDLPVAAGDTVQSDEDTVLHISPSMLLANDSDVDSASDGQVLSVVAAGDAQHCSVHMQPDGTIVFEPEANYVGAASFRYTVDDGAGGQTQATAVVNLASVNDAPVTRDESATGDEDQTLFFRAADLLANDSDPDTVYDGDVLRITRVGAAEHGQVFLQADGVVRFVPDANYHGPAVFSYWVADRSPAELAEGIGYETAATARLTVLPVNDLPVAAGEELMSAEDVVLRIAPALLLANDSDVDTVTDGQRLSVVGVADARHGSVSLQPDGSVLFTPEADYYGAASFRYTIDDGAGGRADATAVVNLAPVNDAPRVFGETMTFDEDQEQTISQASLLANDSDVDSPTSALQIVAVDQPVHGQVRLESSGDIVFTPDADYFGPAAFNYTVSDGAGGFTVGRVTLAIAPVDDAPRVMGEQLTLDEDEVAHFDAAALLANDSDIDDPHSALSIVTVGQAEHGTVQLRNGEIIFTPERNYDGAASFCYLVSDGAGGTSKARVDLTLLPVNDAPTLNGELLWAKAGVGYTLTQAALLTNDSDADGDALRIVAVQGAQHGTVVLLPDGNVSFVPDAGAAGVGARGSFEYVVEDAAGARSTAVAQIDFSRANVAPTATDDSFVGYEDVPLVIAAAQLLSNDSDTDNAAGQLRLTRVDNATHGSVSLDAQGNVRFVPDADYSGQASFRYRVSDGDGGESYATAFMQLAALDDAPVIEDIWFGRPIYGYVHRLLPLRDSILSDDAGNPIMVMNLLRVEDETQARELMARGELYQPDSVTVVSHIDTYRNGHLRPMAFDSDDAVSGGDRPGVSINDAYRENGAVIAYDPDGDSSQLAFSIAGTPQHGHAWANWYASPDEGEALDFTSVPDHAIAENGAWQYSSVIGDLYTGADPFSIRVTDAGGASTVVDIGVSHEGAHRVHSKGWSALAVDIGAGGVEQLRPHDVDQRISAGDVPWSQPGPLPDRNGDGRQDEAEFIARAAVGLESIGPTGEGAAHADRENLVFGTSVVRWADRHVSQVADVMPSGDGVVTPARAEPLSQASHGTSQQLFGSGELPGEQGEAVRTALIFNQFMNTQPSAELIGCAWALQVEPADAGMLVMQTLIDAANHGSSHVLQTREFA